MWYSDHLSPEPERSDFRGAAGRPGRLRPHRAQAADVKGGTMNQKKEQRRTERRNFREALQKELREHKSSFLVFYFLRALVILSLARQIWLGSYESAFFCVLTLLLLIVPSFVQVNFHIEVPNTLEILTMLFIFSAEILGEINEFYVKIPFWDTILHTINGFIAAAIGLSFVVLLNNDARIMFHLSPIFAAIIAFCFSMTVGVLWEFFEFGMDFVFHTDMQKDTVITSISSVLLNPSGHNSPVTIENIRSTAVNGKDLGIQGYLDIGLIDTMKDLFVNFIGALVFSIFGYFYVKRHGKGKAVERFLLTRKKPEKDYLNLIEHKEKIKA